jgi:alkylresorcinol/alkylpyrone synthase
VLIAGSRAALGYDLADDGFRVTLSRRLPQLLAEALPAVVDDFCGERTCAGLDAVVLHPGGTAIVDAVESSLGLRREQLTASRSVLSSTGNTSSAGILFVLQQLAASLPAPVGTGIVLGVGPGLTVELLELSWHC